MQVVIQFMQANWPWFVAVAPTLVQEIIAASPLKANTLGQLAGQVAGWALAKLGDLILPKKV